MRLPITLLCVLICLVLFGCGGDGGSGVVVAPQVTNAGFETPAMAAGEWHQFTHLSGTTWAGEESSGIANGSGSWGSTAHSGSQYGYIQNTAFIEQTISGFTVGRSYRINFWMARRNGNVGGNSPNPMEVVLDSSQTIFGPTAPPDDTEWHAFTTSTFVANKSSYKVTFQGVNTNGDESSLIDDVQIELMP